GTEVDQCLGHRRNQQALYFDDVEIVDAPSLVVEGTSLARSVRNGELRLECWDAVEAVEPRRSAVADDTNRTAGRGLIQPVGYRAGRGHGPQGCRGGVTVPPAPDRRAPESKPRTPPIFEMTVAKR